MQQTNGYGYRSQQQLIVLSIIYLLIQWLSSVECASYFDRGNVLLSDGLVHHPFSPQKSF